MKLSKQELKELFREIGSKERLLSLLLEFYETMSGDVLIGFFFEGKDLRSIAGKQADFLMRAWGASASYDGKAPADAHRGLPGILSGHFDRRLVLLRKTLEDRGLSAHAVKTWVAFENGFRKRIVANSKGSTK